MPRLYASIPHLPGSRAAKDRVLAPSQAARFIDRARANASEREHEVVIVQEKLDGSCVAIRREGAHLVALGREGNLAASSKNEGRRMFAIWVEQNESMLRTILDDSETVKDTRKALVGEWLALVHGTRYELAHGPFVPFDLVTTHTDAHGQGQEQERAPWDELAERIARTDLVMPAVIHRGPPIAIADAVALLGPHGRHHAIDPPEGLVYRVERRRKTRRDPKQPHVVHVMVAKWVNPNKVDGAWLPETTGKPALYHWRPAPAPTQDEKDTNQ